jgi:uncharacterized membrane protein YbhN (UPF0104 family)
MLLGYTFWVRGAAESAVMPMPKLKPKSMLRRLVRWLQPVFLILSVIAIGWFLSNQWPTLRSYPWRLDWGWLLATCVITLASWGVEIAIWQHLLAALGGKLPYWIAARIWFLSAVLRYVPGNVWQPLSLTLYSRRHGVAPEATITSLVLYQVIILLAIAPILVIYFLWIDTKSLAAQFVAQFPAGLVWVALVPVLAFLIRPQWLVKLLNWAFVRLQRPPLAMQLTSKKLLMLILVALADWLLWGGVFAAFTFAVAGDIVADGAAITPLLVASYPIANVIGWLSLITPSGFGVREGAFYLLLTPQISGSVVTVIALGIRVWGIVNELVFALICLPFEQAYNLSNAVTTATPPDSTLHKPAATPDLRREII